MVRPTLIVVIAVAANAPDGASTDAAVQAMKANRIVRSSESPFETQGLAEAGAAIYVPRALRARGGANSGPLETTGTRAGSFHNDFNAPRFMSFESGNLCQGCLMAIVPLASRGDPGTQASRPAVYRKTAGNGIASP